VKPGHPDKLVDKIVADIVDLVYSSAWH